MKRQGFHCPVSVLIGFLLFAIGSVGFAEARRPILNNWFAIGSGCRARHDLSGNVTMQHVNDVPNDQGMVRAVFHLDNFALRRDAASSENSKFARECAIRLNINPPASHRIVEVRAATSWSTTKPKGVSLNLLGQLKIGASLLGEKLVQYDSEAAIAKRDDEVTVASGGEKNSNFPALRCGEPKIIGFDYSWIGEKANGPVPDIAVELNSKRQLLIEARLEKCSS